ncbi:hypothetical protein CEXT_104161 [Caerostris extrusa]|uniref:Pre-C2HC domain-containing protein n=1 Tax=Caerostris extrusa TaxID=172846 RepID=A0AAV4YAX4_CAEEX|nr:hypothetical protein CEXT_104161 [Caerostris extrusa]
MNTTNVPNVPEITTNNEATTAVQPVYPPIVEFPSDSYILQHEDIIREFIPAKTKMANLASKLRSFEEKSDNYNSATPLRYSGRWEQSRDGSTSTTTAKIPPIFIKCRSDWRDTLSILRAEVDDPIRAQISGQFVRINVETEDNFRHVVRFLDSTGMEYKSFMLRNERPIKVVLRGLPASTPESEIAAELTELGYGVHKITKLRKEALLEEMSEVDDPIRAQISGQFVRINVETEDNFRHVVRFLDSTGWSTKALCSAMSDRSR